MERPGIEDRFYGECQLTAFPDRHEKSPTLVDQTKSGIFREKER